MSNPTLTLRLCKLLAKEMPSIDAPVTAHNAKRQAEHSNAQLKRWGITSKPLSDWEAATNGDNVNVPTPPGPALPSQEFKTTPGI